jgi:hypothetical protein
LPEEALCLSVKSEEWGVKRKRKREGLEVGGLLEEALCLSY